MEKQYNSEKWVYVTGIWMNLKNEESKQMVEESNDIITSRIRNIIYAETWKIKQKYEFNMNIETLQEEQSRHCSCIQYVAQSSERFSASLLIHLTAI